MAAIPALGDQFRLRNFARLAKLLCAQSAGYARRVDGNCSVYALAGIPILFSALRCLTIELNAGIFTAAPPRTDALGQLATAPNDVQFIIDRYAVPEDLRRQLRLLLEVRHEIAHPSHQPSSEANNTPTYLCALRDAGLLQSTGKEIDYVWLAQLQSHKLFRWAFEVVRATVMLLLKQHQVTGFAADGLISSYSEYAEVDAA